MKPLKIAVVFSILAMMLSACAESSQIDLEGTTWLLTAFDEKSPIEGTQPTIQFGNGQVSGNTGCNLFSGSYQLNGDDISFGSLAWTERGCVDPEGVMEQETMYVELLGAARRFELEDDGLRIFTDSQEILTFERQVDAPTASSLSTPTSTSPTATAEMVTTPETPAIEPPAGFKEYQASSIGVSVYIPESWTVTDVVEGQYVILQSYPEDKYVGGEMLEAGDTKCDLGIRPPSTNKADLIEGWRSDPTVTILSEEEINLQSGQPGIRIELDSMGRSISVITEINERVVVITCFGDFSLFDEIAATLIASGKR
jgi:heat shock protein HslJ